jgi:uncharacterized protein (TIGR03067 family)
VLLLAKPVLTSRRLPSYEACNPDGSAYILLCSPVIHTGGRMMKTLVAAGVVVALAVCAVGAQDDATKKDLKAMEGTWAVTVHEFGGEKVSEDQNKQFNGKLVVKDGKYTVFTGDMKIGAGTIKLDASKTPKHVDAVSDEGADKGKAMQGIYKIEGETMMVCFGQPGSDRPTEFKTKKDTTQMLLSYKRAKK